MPRWLVPLILLCTLIACDPGPPSAVMTFLTHGPMLGRLTDTSVGVWARTREPGMFRVRYGTSPDALTEVSPPAETELAHDLTAWVNVTGLMPDTRYFYAVTGRARSDKEATAEERGSFRTLPADGQYAGELNPDGLFNFSFEFACGNNQRPDGHGPALPGFRTMIDQHADDVHFAILNGDWLYEDAREFSLEQWAAEHAVEVAQAPTPLPIIPTITGVWENYKVYLERGKNLAEWHRNVPTFYTLDDHEILNDVFGAGEIGRRNRKVVFRDIALRAWYDYLAWSNPVHWTQRAVFGETEVAAGSNSLRDEAANFETIDWAQTAEMNVHWGTADAGVLGAESEGDPNAGVYAVEEAIDRTELRVRPSFPADGKIAYSIGRRNYFKQRIGNVEFFYLDLRSHRSMHNGDNPADPAKTLMGGPQKEWLKQEMSASDADFLFVVSSVNMMVAHRPPGRGSSKGDAWAAYLAEREEMISYWDDLDQPVLVLTGDLHASYSLQVTDNVWEFASGPHNSPHHPSEGRWPPNGPLESGPRTADVRWASYLHDDTPRELRRKLVYSVVQINNILDTPVEQDADENPISRWMAYPRPQVLVAFYDGLTGKLLYAEPVQSLN